jgi:hypothetical protein
MYGPIMVDYRKLRVSNFSVFSVDISGAVPLGTKDQGRPHCPHVKRLLSFPRC